MRAHGLALALALVLAGPILGLAALAARERSPGGRVLAIGAPWRSDVEAVGLLAAAGAEWVVPLWLPGTWLAEIAPGGAARGVILLPVGEASAFLAGCATPSTGPGLARRGGGGGGGGGGG
jgi:hypothetical protein